MERTMRDIVCDILTSPWIYEPHGYNFNGHLVRDPRGTVCIDPVEPTEDDLAALVREGVAWIVLTNRNHSRTANRVRATGFLELRNYFRPPGLPPVRQPWLATVWRGP